MATILSDFEGVVKRKLGATHNNSQQLFYPKWLTGVVMLLLVVVVLCCIVLDFLNYGNISRYIWLISGIVIGIVTIIESLYKVIHHKKFDYRYILLLFIALLICYTAFAI